MADTADAPSSGAPDTFALSPTPPKKRRGRPAGSKSGVKTERKTDVPRQRLDQLKADLERAQEALREFEARRDSVIGKAVLAHAHANPDYRKQLADLLRREVTGKGDLAAIDDLLG